jgi:hypothetical protein
MRITLLSADRRLVLEAADSTIVLSPAAIEVVAPEPMDGRMTVESWQIAELAIAGNHQALAEIGLRLIVLEAPEPSQDGEVSLANRT